MATGENDLYLATLQPTVNPLVTEQRRRRHFIQMRLLFFLRAGSTPSTDTTLWTLAV